MKKCGAKTKVGGKCQYQAGKGTDHLGTGRCRLHGGASKGAPVGNKNAEKHGIYARIFSDAELDAAKLMQGSIETELAIARLQMVRLLEEQKKAGDTPYLDKVEEKTIVKTDEEKKKDNDKESFLKMLVRSAKQAGEQYDPDGDKEHLYEDGDPDDESEIFERKRTFVRRDFQGEFIRLASLIARLEQQLIGSRKTKAEIKIIETTGKAEDADDKLTDTELDQEIQELVGGFSL